MPEKEPTPKIFCLFHQRTDCNCISPVADTKTLKERIEHQIKLNNILNPHELDEDEKRKRDEQTIVLESRLSDLRDV